VHLRETGYCRICAEK